MTEKRYRTKFGVIMPPWKSVTVLPNLTMEFVITGLVPSKKNRQKASFNYSWVFAQVRKFLKEHPEENVKKETVTRFIWSLVKNIHPFLFKPREVLEWEERVKPIITKQAASWVESYKHKGLTFPVTKCRINIKYYWADNYSRDNINKDESIYDILKECGIIADDNYKNVFRITSESCNYTNEIRDHIVAIYVSAYEW